MIFYRTTRRNPLRIIQCYLNDIVSFFLSLIFTRKKVSSSSDSIVITIPAHLGDLLLQANFISYLKSINPNKTIILLTLSQNKILEVFLSDIVDIFEYIDFPLYSRSSDSILYKYFLFFKRLFFLRSKYAYKASAVYLPYVGFPSVAPFISFIFSVKLNGFINSGYRFLFIKPVDYFSFSNLHESLLGSKLLSHPIMNFPHYKFSNNSILDPFVCNTNFLPNTKFVLIHSGVSTISRQWKLDNWILLVNSLISNSYYVGFVYSNSEERSFVNRIFESLDLPSSTNFYDTSDSILSLYYLITQCDLFIGLESFSSHFASMLGSESISLYTDISDSNRMRPISKSVTVFVRKLGCGPCYNNHCARISCLNDIDAHEVFNFLKDKL